MRRQSFRPQCSRLLLLVCMLAASHAHAQDRYPHVPAQLYRVGMLEWKNLRKDPDGRRRFNLFTDRLEAGRYLESYGGKDKTIYVIDKQDFVRTAEGREFLKTLEQERIRNPEAGEWAVLLPTEASYVATIRQNAKVDFKPESPPAAAGADAVPGPGPPEKPTPSASDPDYPYERAHRIVYVVGQKTWDELIPTDGRLTVFANYELAREHAGGQRIYRIYRHSLEGTDDGKAFLEKQQVGKDAEILEMKFSSADSYDRTVLKRAKTGNDLGPVNPHWKTSGDTKPSRC